MGGSVRTFEELREEKKQVWEGSVARTGCKAEIDSMAECSKDGDWRKCKDQMATLKVCMDASRARTSEHPVTSQ